MSLLKLGKIVLCMFIYFCTSVERGLKTMLCIFLSVLYFLRFFHFRASEVTNEVKAVVLRLIKQLPHF